LEPVAVSLVVPELGELVVGLDCSKNHRLMEEELVE
jgi:hypothetical protein